MEMLQNTKEEDRRNQFERCNSEKCLRRVVHGTTRRLYFQGGHGKKVNRKKFTKRLPIRIELHDDVCDAAAISANLFLRRDALLMEFPDVNGQRLGTVKIEHHNGDVNLVYWDSYANQANGEGTIIPLFQVITSTPNGQ